MRAEISEVRSTDLAFLVSNDHHLDQLTIQRKVEQREFITARYQNKIIGWLRYGLFWDSIPFMNLIWVEESYRNQGIGSQLIAFWEERMNELGKQMVMTSTLANERAQSLYRKLGYKDKGALFLEGEAAEIILIKDLVS